MHNSHTHLTYIGEPSGWRIHAMPASMGLSGSVIGDPERAYAVARQLRTGQVGINCMELSPAAPFGGYKMSGVGREGLRAYLKTKAILAPR